MTIKLLGKDDPAPVEVINEEGKSPFLFASEHAGNRVPEKLGNLGLSAENLADHIGWDLHIRKVGEQVSALLDAPYYVQPYSRLVIDSNRPPFAEQSILAVSDGRRVPGNEGLTPGDIDARQFEVFFPFHDAIASALDKRAAEGLESIFVTLHSFTPSMKTGDNGRPWQITFQYGRDPFFSKKMIAEMGKDPAICVGDNVPYPVMDDTHYGIPIHGEKRKLLHTMIEIRQDVISDVEGQVFWARKVADVLRTVLSDVRSNRIS